MPKRVQSPSSINLYKQCPRRYFYSYILKYPTQPNIHCVRGNIVHSALEDFYDLKPETIDPMNLKKELAAYLKNLFDAHWNKRRAELNRIRISDEELKFYYDDSVSQLANWLSHLFKDIDAEMRTADFVSAWKALLPHAREIEYKDLDLGVRGFVDAIFTTPDGHMLIDYKTSKKFDMTPEYRLQLGIYAVLYQAKHGSLPKKAGIWFLKDSLKLIDVDESLIKEAKFEIEQIHFATESKEITDYRRKPGPLCRYSTGQCDFFDICKPFQDVI